MSADRLPQHEPLPDWLPGITRRRVGDAAAVPRADDSNGTARLQRLQCEDATLDRYRDNIDLLTARLHQEESRLDAIVGHLLEARRLISRNGLHGPASNDLAHAASALKSLRSQVVAAIDNAPPAFDEAQHEARSADLSDDLWVADGVSHRIAPTLPDISGITRPLDPAIQLFEQPDGQRDDVAWRVEIDRTLLELDSGFDTLNTHITSIVSARHRLQALSDNHTNVSLSNKHLAMSLGQLDDDAAALLLQGHELALHASHTAQRALAELSLFDDR